MKTLADYLTSSAVMVVALLLFLSQALAQNTYVTGNELREAFEEGDIDRLIFGLNTVKQMSYQGEALEFLMEVWQEQVQWNDSEIAEYIAGLPIVRMEIANVLLQANRNGIFEFDSNAARMEALSHIRSRDVALLGTVISNLAIIDHEDDVESIKQIALQRNPSTFRSAVLGLSMMCGEKANLALNDLEPVAVSMGEEQHLAEVRESMTAIRSILCR